MKKWRCPGIMGAVTNRNAGNSAMKSFLQQHASQILGVLRGFDRIRFRGTFRQLAYVDAMTMALNCLRVLLKDFGRFAEDKTNRFRQGVEEVADKAGRRVIYIASPSQDKEKLVDGILRAEGVSPDGVIAILSAVEVCRSFYIYRDRASKKLVLRSANRKCLHYYVYLEDSMFGRVQVRMQTWFPFNVHIVLNGREWLARQMTAAKIAFQRRDNCFSWVSDFARAQKLFDKQLTIDWVKHLTRLVDRANPILRQLMLPWEMEPYWSAEQSEWATDIAFRSAKGLRALFDNLLKYAITTFDSRDVLRFLGRKLPKHTAINGRFAGEVVSDVATRPEGTRIKHRVKGNTIKLYDKQGSVLRVETTINDAGDLKAFRRKEGDPKGPKAYRKLRKGVADLRRRAHLCDAANNRYLESLAAAESPTPLHAFTDELCRPVSDGGRRFRALNPLGVPDAQLLRLIAHGEHLIKGFRNQDIREALFGKQPPALRRKHASHVSRLLRLLRAHRLIKKVPRTHRYLLTAKGTKAIPAILAAHAASVDKLLAAA